MLHNSWKEYCISNKYKFDSLITWNNRMYLTYDLLNKLWVIGRVTVSDKGIENCNTTDILFFDTSDEAVACFESTMRSKLNKKDKNVE